MTEPPRWPAFCDAGCSGPRWAAPRAFGDPARVAGASARPREPRARLAFKLPRLAVRTRDGSRCKSRNEEECLGGSAPVDWADAAPRRPRRGPRTSALTPTWTTPAGRRRQPQGDDGGDVRDTSARGRCRGDGARPRADNNKQILKLNFKTRGSPGPASGNITPQATAPRGPSPRSAPARRFGWISNQGTSPARRTRRS